jgi:hypothetical protein
MHFLFPPLFDTTSLLPFFLGQGQPRPKVCRRASLALQAVPARLPFDTKRLLRCPSGPPVPFPTGKARGEHSSRSAHPTPYSVLHRPHPLGFQKQLMSCVPHNLGCEGSSPRLGIRREPLCECYLQHMVCHENGAKLGLYGIKLRRPVELRIGLRGESEP